MTKDDKEPMTNRRLIVVSNRLPFNVSVSDGQFEFHDSAGGVATGLASYIQFAGGPAHLPKTFGSDGREPALNLP